LGWPQQGNALSILLRCEMAMANASYRTLQQLLFMQDRRRKRNGSIAKAEPPVEVTAQLVASRIAAE
jgi:hypothetical protein